eukprot:11631573-Heterocapsa_arctica.AAC.1
MNKQQAIQQTEKDDTQAEDFHQNKKPRIEEMQDGQHNLLNLLRKRKDNQYHYGSAQSTEKGKTDKKADRATPVARTITSFFIFRAADVRSSDACPPGLHPRANTDISAACAERPRYSEHPA